MATKEDIEKAETTPGTDVLPPSGYGRREALIRRQANLDREIAARAESMLVQSIDPEKMYSIDNEIAALALDGSDVPHQRSDREYLWVEYNDRLPSDHGHHVIAAQQLGYKFVTKTDTEAKGLDHATITPEGYIRWGSAILMWIERDRYVMLRALERARQARIEGEHLSASRLVELGEKYGVQIHTDLPPEALSRAKAQYQAQQRRQSAWKRIDQNLREGLPTSVLR